MMWYGFVMVCGFAVVFALFHGLSWAWLAVFAWSILDWVGCDYQVYLGLVFARSILDWVGSVY